MPKLKSYNVYIHFDARLEVPVKAENLEDAIMVGKTYVKDARNLLSKTTEWIDGNPEVEGIIENS